LRSPPHGARRSSPRRWPAWEAQQARQLYEELVLKKPETELVQIGPPRQAPQAAEEKVII